MTNSHKPVMTYYRDGVKTKTFKDIKTLKIWLKDKGWGYEIIKEKEFILLHQFEKLNLDIEMEEIIKDLPLDEKEKKKKKLITGTPPTNYKGLFD